MSIVAEQSAAKTQGWQASLSLRLERLGARTVLRHGHQGPLRVQRPFYPEGHVCHVYLLHPPAGVVGGDQLNIQLSATPQTGSVITTPGATQFYRSGGATAQIRQQIDTSSDCHVDWLPQENIYFSGARADISTTVSLQGNASLIGWDLHCFGRPSADERFEAGRVVIAQRLERDGKPLLRERLVVESPLRADAVTGLRGFAVCGSLYATPVSKPVLLELRELLQPQQDVLKLTLIDDLLIARYLGHSTAEARATFQTLWQALRPHVHQRPACAPRIWAT